MDSQLTQRYALKFHDVFPPVSSFRLAPIGEKYKLLGYNMKQHEDKQVPILKVMDEKNIIEFKYAPKALRPYCDQQTEEEIYSQNKFIEVLFKGQSDVKMEFEFIRVGSLQ